MIVGCAFWLLGWCALFRCARAVYCPNPPPGVAAMSRAVDVTKLDLLPLDILTDNGYGRRVIVFTCDEGKKWTSPFGARTTYDLPDQIETINSIPGGVLDVSYRAFRDYRNAKKSMSANAGVEFLKGMFSGSGSYKRTQHSITNSSKSVLTVGAHFSALQIDFAPSWEQQIIRSAKVFIERRLPTEFTANPNSFNQFIGTYGTHFFASGKFGGVFRLVIETESSLNHRMSDRDMEANAKGSFFGLLKANGAYQGSNTEVNEQFRTMSQMTSRYFGGSANLLAADNWLTWAPTVPENPWLFGGKLEPITDLLEDGPKTEALKRAIEVYLDKAYLQEMQRTLNAFLGKGRIGEDRAREFLVQVTALLAQVAPDHATVSSLGDRVDDFFLAPDWFVKQTLLCYYWYPDGDGGQCGGSSRTLCAPTNQMTPYYRDDTDKRGGGCQMRWGITTTGAPAWFNQVKICFRWFADGDGGQCGGSAPAETCAQVGDSTVWYRDDTDRRPGGCRMSWRFNVPTDAPGWLLNTKLCYSWYPDGDGGQCGAGEDRNLCAVANQWTQYYRDDTDKRGGGCQMSWGLQTLNQ